MAVLTEGIHRHGALAGVELWHGGLRPANGLSRRTGVAPVSLPVTVDPWQTKAMDRSDILALSRVTSRRGPAGACGGLRHRLCLCRPHLSPRPVPRSAASTSEPTSMADRSSIARAWCVKCSPTCAMRSATNAPSPSASRSMTRRDRRRIALALLDMLKDEADLFDVTICDYSQEMGVSRFVKEAPWPSTSSMSARS